MPTRSAKFGYTSEEQRRFEDQLRFIREHRNNYPRLARSVAEETGYTTPNVYSVFSGSTFNAAIIRAGYAQICRLMGMISPDSIPQEGNEEDEKALRLLSEAQNARMGIAQYLVDFRDLRNKISRKTKDLKIIDGNLELLLTICLEEMSDSIAVEIREYLSTHADPAELPSQAIDTEEIPEEIIKAIAMMKASGDITEDGFLSSEPVMVVNGLVPDGPEVDIFAPGRHVDAEGVEFYLPKD